MQKATYSTLALSVIAATTLAFVLGPALIQSASAVPAPKTEERCDDPKFADRESCPGNSEDAASDKRDDNCIARNPGQAKNCPDGATDVVNPPNR
jgi:hypothetical protein